ncbi:MAG: helix-turn-helix domain-containing protein [Thermodesulfobacteriota bacterium]
MNVIDYAFVLCPGGAILPEHLPASLSGRSPAPQKPRPQETDSPGPRRVSREELIQALHAAQGQKSKTAALLGVSRVTLWKWLKEYNVQVETVVRG